MAVETLGIGIKKLGFGLMRLPMIGDSVDIEQTKKMVDMFMKRGFTYFDSAYVYLGGDSERAAKEALTSRYPRESYQFATKFPVHLANSKEDAKRLFEEQLERTGLQHFDFYLMHNATDQRMDRIESLGLFDFMKELKDAGKIKHMGFSYHGKHERLDTVLKNHPEIEFVQLQLNYLDWYDDFNVQSRLNYKACRRHGVPVIVMEPVKGGQLVALTDEITASFKSINPMMSNPSWAIRYAASLDGVLTVLSGMSDLSQMEDNSGYMQEFRPLGEAEKKAVETAAMRLRSIPGIPCTDCRYCIPECPKGILIPKFLSVYNEYMQTKYIPGIARGFGLAVGRDGSTPTEECIACGACESACPQHIAIIDGLKMALNLKKLL